MAVNEGTDKCNKEKSADLSLAFRALMNLLQNSDTSLKQEGKSAEYQPFFVDRSSAFLLKGKINEEDQNENNKKLIHTKAFAKENAGQGGDDH